MNRLLAVPYTVNNVDMASLSSRLTLLPRGASIAIYGAGENGRALLVWLLRKGVSVSCLCDRDPAKRPQTILGAEVIAPEELFKRRGSDYVVISPLRGQSEIFEYLAANGIPEENIIRLPFTELSGRLRIPEDALPENAPPGYAVIDPPHTARARSGRSLAPQPREAPVMVSTAVYNIRESYLRRAIESVLNQTYENFRYLIIDNGSTDGSREIIGEYARLDGRVEALSREANITGAGWDKAEAAKYREEYRQRLTSEYICRLDADDYLHPKFLERLYGLASEYGADIAACKSLHYREGNPQDHWSNSFGFFPSGYYGPNTAIYALLEHMQLWRSVWGKLMKTRVYLSQQEGAARGLGNINDVYKMFGRVLASKSLYVTDEILHYYTLRRASASLNLARDTEAVTRIYNLYEWLYDKLAEYGAATELNAAVIRDFAFAHIERPDIELLTRAVRVEPLTAAEALLKILAAEPPEGLARDARTRALGTKLQALLQAAEQNGHGV